MSGAGGSEKPVKWQPAQAMMISPVSCGRPLFCFAVRFEYTKYERELDIVIRKWTWLGSCQDTLSKAFLPKEPEQAKHQKSKKDY